MTQRQVHEPDCAVITGRPGPNQTTAACTCNAKLKRAEQRKKRKAAAASSDARTAGLSDGATSLGEGNYWRRPLRGY